MRHDPTFFLHADGRTLAAVHEAARQRARELRAQAMDAFWSALLRWARERLRNGRRPAAAARRPHAPCAG
jgi:hypothetical protein